MTTFRRNSIARIVAQGFGKLALFGWMTLLARSLHPEGFGIYTYLWTVVGLVGIFSDFGLGFGITRSIARNPGETKRLFSESLQLRFLLGIVAYGLLALLVVSRGQQPGLVVPALILGLTIFTISGINGFNAILNGREEIQTSSLMSGLVPLLTLLIGFALFLQGASLVRATAASVFAGLIVLAVQSLLFRSKGIGFERQVDPRSLLGMAVRTSPVFLMSLLATLNVGLDTILLKHLSGDAAVGLYNVSYRIVLALAILPVAIGDAAFPIWSKALHSTDANRRLPLSGVVRLLLLVALPTSLVLYLTAPFLIRTAFGEAYAASIPILRIHAFTLVLMFLNAPLGYRLIAWDRMREINVTFAAVVATNAIANLILIPRYGLAGAAVATLLSEGLNSVLLLTWVRRLSGPPSRTSP